MSLDDIVVHSNTWGANLEVIRALFRRFSEARLTVNLAKCEFARATVTYLGKVVGRGQVRPVRASIAQLVFFPRKFLSYQSSYSVIEKEALGLIWAP